MRLVTVVSTYLLGVMPVSFARLPFVQPLFPNRVEGCQYPSSDAGTYIYFNSPNESDFKFSIFTYWSRYYPDKLKSALVLGGFSLEGLHGAAKTDMCGWNKWDTVEGMIWHRGDVNFKDTRVHNPSPHDAKPHKSRLTRHILRAAIVLSPPPHRSPSNTTLSTIHQILVDNAPSEDVVAFIHDILAPIAYTVVALAVLSIARILMRQILRYMDTKKEKEQMQGIELPSLNGRCVSLLKQDEVEPPTYTKELDELMPKNNDNYRPPNSSLDLPCSGC